MPAGQRLNSVLQIRMGGLRDFEANVDTKIVADWLVLADLLRELRVPIEGSHFLEIGTGWFPTLPCCFAIAGAKGCHTFDVTRHLDWGLTERMLARLEAHLPIIAARLDTNETVVRERWRRMAAATDLGEFLRISRIAYHAPADAATANLAAASIDIVFSNSVLEHVPAVSIAGLMRETRRVLRRDGVAIHSVNCGDHYAYFDRKITQIHYLRYGELHWSFWNNALQYQNRLRANDFIEIAERAGLSVVLNRQKPRAELLERIDSMPIAKPFRRYSREQVCTTSVDFVARRQTE